MGPRMMRCCKRPRTRRPSWTLYDEELQSLSHEITHKGEDEQIQVKRRIEELKGEMAREESRGEMAEKAIAEMDAQQKTCFIQIGNIGRSWRVWRRRLVIPACEKPACKESWPIKWRICPLPRRNFPKADAQYLLLRDELAAARQLREEAKTRLGDLVRERDRLLDATRRAGLEKEELSKGIKRLWMPWQVPTMTASGSRPSWRS